jgi:hypothetical protein
VGFQEERSAISICNKALDQVKQQPLSGSLDDPANLNKNAARICNLWYKKIVRSVLSAHHWGLATKRVPLVAVAVNDRPTEWSYAYAPPSDMAFPVMVGPYGPAGTAVSYYRGVGFLIASIYGKPVLRYESGTIYSIVPDATLDYVSFDITEQDFNDAVEDLVILFLASRLARSIAKDDKLADSLYNQAIRLQNVEIARSFNANQPRYGNTASDSEMARGGFDPLLSNYGFPI